jgi:hypothetical protein
MFPAALGARVLISGHVVVLFKNQKDIEKSWELDGFASVFGNLRLMYDVLDCTPSQKVLYRSAAITDTPDNYASTASLGLKVRLHDGTEAVTVPTHAFVEFRTLNTTIANRVVDLYAQVKKKLARFKPAGKEFVLPTIFSGREPPRGNSPLGKKVYLSGKSQEVSFLQRTSLSVGMI